MTFKELKKLAETTVHYDKEDLLALTDRAQGGDRNAMDELVLALLPKFCEAYSHEIGRRAENPELLEDCFDRYRKTLETFDFHQTGESFFHRLSWHLRQARTNDITRAVSLVSGVSKEEEKMCKNKEES